MNITKASKRDLADVANVHINCFRDSFSTQLGIRLLTKFYNTYFEKNPDLFCIAKDSSDVVVGFCMGYLSSDENLTNRFIKKNFFHFLGRCLLLAVTFNKRFWTKFFSFFRKTSKEIIVVDEELFKVDTSFTGDLLSICVLPEYRGKGVSSLLMSYYEKELLKKNMKYCALSVEPKNAIAIHFYKKHGYKECKKSNNCLVYKKVLSEIE